MSQRAAFSLTEVLVALMIFSIVSLAMVGSLLMGTRLFRDGEMRRAANDEAMAVLALIHRDIERAIPAKQGGVFYAVVPDDERPSCVVGWTIANPDPLNADAELTRFVLWGRDRRGRLRRASLVSEDAIDALDTNNGSLDDDDPRLALEARGETVNRNAAYFGAWLAGTRLEADHPDATGVIPQQSSWWRDLEDADPGSSATVVAEPVAGAAPYTNSDLSSQRFAYPSTLRLVLLMQGRDSTRKEGIVYTDDGAQNITVGGLQGVPSVSGSVLLVDSEPVPATGPFEGNPKYEIIGHTGLAGQRLLVNTTATDGPLGIDGDGRGAYRSVKQTHTRGDRVRFCQTLTLVKAMPR